MQRMRVVPVAAAAAVPRAITNRRGVECACSGELPPGAAPLVDDVATAGTSNNSAPTFVPVWMGGSGGGSSQPLPDTAVSDAGGVVVCRLADGECGDGGDATLPHAVARLNNDHAHDRSVRAILRGLAAARMVVRHSAPGPTSLDDSGRLRASLLSEPRHSRSCGSAAAAAAAAVGFGDASLSPGGVPLYMVVGLAGLSTAEALRYVDVDMAEPNRSRISHLWKICSVLASTSVGMSVAGRSGPAGNATLAGTQRPRSSGLTTTMSQESWCGAQHFFFLCVTATACGGLSPVGALATNR